MKPIRPCNTRGGYEGVCPKHSFRKRSRARLRVARFSSDRQFKSRCSFCKQKCALIRNHAGSHQPLPPGRVPRQREIRKKKKTFLESALKMCLLELSHSAPQLLHLPSILLDCECLKSPANAGSCAHAPCKVHVNITCPSLSM